jgi:hypothetical protein
MRTTKMAIKEIDLGRNKETDSIVMQMEEKYPLMTDDFKRIQREQYELFCRKQSNYGPDNISLGTTLERENDRKLSLQGLFFRLNDKINRYKQMIMFGSVDAVGESLEDTFKDISVYGIIAQLVQNGKWGK